MGVNISISYRLLAWLWLSLWSDDLRDLKRVIGVFARICTIGNYIKTIMMDGAVRQNCAHIECRTCILSVQLLSQCALRTYLVC